jgi:hypothetical protein
MCLPVLASTIHLRTTVLVISSSLSYAAGGDMSGKPAGVGVGIESAQRCPARTAYYIARVCFAYG